MTFESPAVDCGHREMCKLMLLDLDDDILHKVLDKIVGPSRLQLQRVPNHRIATLVKTHLSNRMKKHNLRATGNVETFRCPQCTMLVKVQPIRNANATKTIACDHCSYRWKLS